MSEDEAYDRAGVDQLPEKCYREVHKKLSAARWR